MCTCLASTNRTFQDRPYLGMQEAASHATPCACICMHAQATGCSAGSDRRRIMRRMLLGWGASVADIFRLLRTASVLASRVHWPCLVAMQSI